MSQVSETYYKWDFWSKENLRYVQPHFRMEKAARLVNRIARGKECDLLDVGCGPATLQQLLQKNVNYHGIDIAIQNAAPHLLQMDFLEKPINFADKKFDIILAQGVFEYVGTFQAQKCSEIAQLLKEGGRFVVSYVNFNHRDRRIYWPYSNVQPLREFRRSLEQYFQIERFFPTSHHWHHHEPQRRLMKLVQLQINTNIPFISPMLGVEYFFICSALGSTRTGS
jgi:SAM-dependent methyltransferase